MSTDRRLALQTTLDALVPDDTNAANDVYQRDLTR